MCVSGVGVDAVDGCYFVFAAAKWRECARCESCAALFSSGVVKLEVGDHLELLIPRSTANVSLYGDSTFMGAVKLA